MVLLFFSLWCKRNKTCPADTIICIVLEVAVENISVKNSAIIKFSPEVLFTFIAKYIFYVIKSIWLVKLTPQINKNTVLCLLIVR